MSVFSVIYFVLVLLFITRKKPKHIIVPSRRKKTSLEKFKLHYEKVDPPEYMEGKIWAV